MLYLYGNILNTSTTDSMAEFLTPVGTLFTQILTWLGNLATTILGTPILAMGFYILIISFTVGLFIRIAGSR